MKREKLAKTFMMIRIEKNFGLHSSYKKMFFTLITFLVITIVLNIFINKKLYKKNVGALGVNG